MWRSLSGMIVCALACAMTVPRAAIAQTVPSVVVPPAVLFSFDHVLSIYEWHGAFDAPLVRADHALTPQFDIHLHGNSRFLPLDSLATTEATGLITVMQRLANYDAASWSLAPFVMLA